MRNLHLSTGQYASSGANAQKRFEQNLSTFSTVSLGKPPRVGMAQPFSEESLVTTNTSTKRKQFSTKERT